MSRITSLIFFLAVGLGLFAALAPAADQTKFHEGIIVSADNNKLVMTDKQGKNEQSHNVGFDTTITLDNKPVKLADLKKGHLVKVTTDKKGENQVVVAIDATSKNF